MPRLKFLDRSRQFEHLEPRTLLAADGIAHGAHVPDMYLPGSIAGSVFVSFDGSLVRQPSDPSISGVVVQLYDAAGRLVGQSETDDSGAYEFFELPPGSYTLRQLQPEEFENGAALVGTGGGAAASKDEVIGIGVSPGDILVEYDFAEKLPAPLTPSAPAAPMPQSIVEPAPVILPPLSPQVDWPARFSRVAIEAPTQPVRKSSPQLPAAPARPPEPVFGGSSATIDPTSRELKATLETLADEKAEVAAAEATGETSEQHRRRTAQRATPIDARDQAFQQTDAAASDEAADASSAPTHRVAARPAA